MTAQSPPQVNQHSYDAQDSFDLDIQDLLTLIWRKKWFITLIIIAAAGIAFMLAHMQQPRYKAKALIALNMPSSSPLSSLSFGRNVSSQSLSSKMEIIRSRFIAKDVIQKLDLLNNPHFSKSVQHKNNIAEQNAALPFLLQNKAFKSFQFSQTNLPAQENLHAQERELDIVITKFLQNLSVKLQANSSVIRIEYTANSPVLSAQIVNALIDAYIRHNRHIQDKSSALVKVWLSEQIDTINHNINQAEQKLVQLYKDQGTILQTQQATQQAHQAHLNAKILKTNESLLQLDSYKKLIDRGEYQNIPDIQNNALIERLRITRAEQEKHIAHLSARYGNKHPTLIQARSQLQSIETRISQETERLAATFIAQHKHVQSNLKALHIQLEALNKQALNSIDSNLTAQSVQRSLDGYKQLYLQIMQRKQEIEFNAAQAQNVQIIAQAVPALHPISPNKKLIVTLGVLIGALFALIFVIIRDKMDYSVRSASQLEHATQAPCFGLIPDASDYAGAYLSDYVLKKPKSILAEAIRSLRVSIELNMPRNKSHIITITSSFSGEGKTLLSTWLARSSAQSGQRVLLIDCDLRRPNVHKTLGQDNEASLVEYLTDQSHGVDNLIQKDPHSPLHLIYARSVPSRALDLINSKRMHKLVKALEQKYDLIILDTPAYMAVSDSRILASLSDMLIYVVDWKKTPIHIVQHCMRQVARLPCTIASVLTNVNLARHAHNGYGHILEYYDDE